MTPQMILSWNRKSVKPTAPIKRLEDVAGEKPAARSQITSEARIAQRYFSAASVASLCLQSLHRIDR